MCWLDKKSVNQMFKLRDKYNINTFVETGVFRGVNVRFHSFHWNKVLSCDISDEYLDISREYNKDRDNVVIKKQSSANFIKDFIKQYEEDGRTDIVFFFLDAHFYDPNLSAEDMWVVEHELKALEGFENCVICIHDFDCSGLGHCCYNGQPLGFPLVMKYLDRINDNFSLYVNKKEWCDIYDEETIREVSEIIVDDLVVDTVRNTNSCERLKYRGLLYCTPTELDIDKFDLKRA